MILLIAMSNIHKAWVLLIGSNFCLTSHGYATLDALGRQCAHIQFQEPRTKWWLFDTLVTRTLLAGVESWESRLNKANNGKYLERPLVSTISRIIRSKGLLPHDTIWEKIRASQITMRHFSNQWVVSTSFGKSRCTQGWELICHQNYQLNKEMIVVGMLKHNNGSTCMS